MTNYTKQDYERDIKILEGAPEGTSHYVLHNGTDYHFKIYELNAEIWTEDGWMEYETQCALPDLQGVQNLSDILALDRDWET